MRGKEREREESEDLVGRERNMERGSKRNERCFVFLSFFFHLLFVFFFHLNQVLGPPEMNIKTGGVIFGWKV